MKRNSIVAVLVLISAFFLQAVAICQDQSEYKTEDMGIPGPEHRILKKFEGEWRQLFNASAPNGEITYGKGSTLNTVFYGGRYLKMESELTIEKVKVQSMFLIGYDRILGKYVIYGIDEMTTQPIIAHGAYNKGTKTFTFLGESPDQKTGKQIPFRIVISFPEDRKYIYEFFITRNNKETRYIENTHIRMDK
jgi:hypothetical protein